MNELYKYLPPDRIDVLQNLAIRISQPCALNDPHDALVAIRSRLEEQSGAEGVIADDFEVERIYAQMTREEWSSQIGVISFSKDPLNVLMWSHYAAAHSGFLLHFNQDSTFFRRNLTWYHTINRVETEYEGLPYPSEVIYTDFREPMYIEDGIPWDLLFRKSKEWSYEKEFRSLMNISDGDLLTSTGNHRWPVFLVPLHNDTLCGVTLGLETNDKHKEEIISISTKHRIPVFKLVMEHLSYKLKQVPLIE